MSKIIRTALAKSVNAFANLIVWPEIEALRENQPACLNSFKNCFCIIDCTEIYIERSLNLNAKAQTFSNCKSHKKVNCLLEVALALRQLNPIHKKGAQSFFFITQSSI